MQIDTHQKIDRELCGRPLEVGGGCSRVELTATARMAADASGLVHGGFIFGLADYAAMVAVNHPNVVLGAADVKFLKPVVVRQTVVASAKTVSVAGKKHLVEVSVSNGETIVFNGVFTCFALDAHVLGS
jgi:uncharacterized protein (TIGR00369 family)